MGGGAEITEAAVLGVAGALRWARHEGRGGRQFYNGYIKDVLKKKEQKSTSTSQMPSKYQEHP